MPQAPKITISVDNRHGVSSWFDVLSRSTFEKPLEEIVAVKHVRDNAVRLNKVVEREVEILKGDSQRLFICGISQGAAMAITLSLQAKHKLGGICVASGFFLTNTDINEANLETPLWAFHGTKDTIRPWETVKATYDELKKRKPFNTEVELIETGDDFDEEFIREKWSKMLRAAVEIKLY